ncbi:MAG TPA: STAS domain-containing protein [Amycolatopsis sp.]|nr:STAS domain-containing protein [Amycolatopsis sp.]
MTTTLRDGVRVLTPVGDLDAATAGLFTAALAEATEPVVADLSRVEFLGCAGIRALITTPPLAVVGSDAVRRALTVTGADSALTLHPTLAGALAAATVH